MSLKFVMINLVTIAALVGHTQGNERWWKLPTAVLTTPQNHRTDFAEIKADVARGVAHAGWYGIWYQDAPQKIRFSSHMAHIVQHARMKRMIYFDTGEMGEYVVFAGENGQLLYDAWSLPSYKGEAGKIHWFGLRSFMNGAPWTTLRSASHYGVPAFTYPDGRMPDPDKWYEMLGNRDINGKLNLSFFSNNRLSDEVAERTGLSMASTRQRNKNPAMAGKSGWITVRNWHIDRANPQYLDYHCKEIEVVLAKQKPDAIHFDDYGGDNTLSIRRAGFGAYSINNFRNYMSDHFTTDELDDMGIADIKSFDVIDYFKNRPWRRGSAEEPKKSYWYNQNWMNDLVFKCYQMSLIESGREHYRRLHEAVKKQASSVVGKIPVFANAIPTFPGKVFLRGIIDVPCYEWKAFKTYGLLQKEMGYPPLGRIGWSSRLAAQFSGTGYSVPSIYVSKDKMGPQYSELHKVLQFDCLANRAVCDYGHWFLDGYSPGTATSAGFGNAFLRKTREQLGRRKYVADIGLVYCGWSQYAANVMGGHQGYSPSRDLFLKEYVGWGEFLGRSSRQWDVLLSQDLGLEHLAGFSIVVLPSIASLDTAQVEVLGEYVKTGGRLVITGETGKFRGPDGYLMPHAEDVLRPLRNMAGVKVVKDKPGCNYRDQEQREAIDALLDFDDVRPVLTTDAPATIAVSLSESAKEEGAMTLDIVNYDLKLAANTVTPTKPISIRIQHPALKKGGKPQLQWIRAGDGVDARWESLPAEMVQVEKGNGTLEIAVPSLKYYAIVKFQL